MSEQKREGDDAEAESKASPKFLASFASARAPRYEAPQPERLAYVAEVETRQGAYMAASGTLTQFNAIIAAIHGSILAGATDVLLKSAIATGLLLHVLAAFVLCWAARPMSDKFSPREAYLRRADPIAAAMAGGHRHADDTFRNYRRGWRVTLLAVAVSSATAILFVLHAFGISVVGLSTG